MFNIVMPIAGQGSRFRKAGIDVPKPLIEVNGRPMAYWALSSLTSVLENCHVVLVLLRAHIEQYDIAEVLTKHIPGATIAVAERLTGGSLESCMLSRTSVCNKALDGHPLIALDGDLVFRSAAYAKLVRSMDSGGEAFDGALLSFRSNDPRYSFAELRDGAVVRTVEKVAISDHALVGAYAFRRAAQFYDIAAEIVADNERVSNGEFYISNAYNRLLKRGGRIGLADVDAYWSMGTPEELAAAKASPDFAALLEQLAAPR